MNAQRVLIPLPYLMSMNRLLRRDTLRISPLELLNSMRLLDPAVFGGMIRVPPKHLRRLLSFTFESFPPIMVRPPAPVRGEAWRGVGLAFSLELIWAREVTISIGVSLLTGIHPNPILPHSLVKLWLQSLHRYVHNLISSHALGVHPKYVF